jgi:hypothetical protein
MTPMLKYALGATLLVTACGGNDTTRTAPPDPGAAPAAQKVGDGPFQPPPIEVKPDLPQVKIDGATGSLPLSSAASYGWSAFIALNWPAATVANTRGLPDKGKLFGQPGTPVWVTMRSKVEVFPGNGAAHVAPHGVVLDAAGKPTNGPDYGYGNAPQYVYSTGALKACAGQPPVATPAFNVLDETTQINNNKTFAGAAPAVDPQGYNTKPQLIRYGVKMNRPIYSYAVAGQYWYGTPGSPLALARTNFQKALAVGGSQDPTTPFVNYAPVFPNTDPNLAGIEIKAAWRPLSPSEASSGRFLTSTVRYYEQPDGVTSCYRESVWGLVGMHVISFSLSAPWVIWTSFEQADNILTAEGRPTEDVDGNRIVRMISPTTPALTSNPDVANPTVTASGPYCDKPGARLYFRENPAYGTMPSGGNICVNSRWTPPEPTFIDANQKAHKAIADYFTARGGGSSPLMYYKLVGAQGVPVDYADRRGGTFSTEVSYFSANVTIETDYSLGNFTGRLVKGVPSNLGPDGAAFYNTQLLPFQAARLGLGKMRMGGCAGCHDIAALGGKDFSFALGNNVAQPEKTNALGASNPLRSYFPLD